MSWGQLLDLIAEEAGNDMAERIEDRARRELGGLRITISVKKHVTKKIIDRVAPGKPKEAAKRLGVHPATIYRRLIR